jgi:hypothetical protein
MQQSSSSIGALATALAKAQIELVNPEKSMRATIRSDDKHGAEQIFRYAPLSIGLEILRKTLGRHEIAILQATAIDQAVGVLKHHILQSPRRCQHREAGASCLRCSKSPRGHWRDAPGPASYRRYIREAVANLKAINPDYLIPAHCTGETFCEIAKAEMPGKIIRSTVGARFTFSA